MPEQSYFLKPRFIGERFKGTLPLSILEDLSAFEDLLTEVAKYIYFKENPGRKRVPNGFSEGVSLELSAMESGSTIPVIMLALNGMFQAEHQYLEKARDTIIEIVSKANNNVNVNGIISNDLLKKFNKIGKNLGEDEAIDLAPALPYKSVINKQTRKKIVLASGENYYLQKVFIRCRVTAYDKETRECTVRFLDNTLKIKVPSPFQRTIMEAYDRYEAHDNKVLIGGIGKMDKADRLETVESVDTIDKLDPLDVLSRLEELSLLKEGWYDGNGESLGRDDLNWFGKTFEEKFDRSLQLPCIFPTPAGEIQLEWNNSNYSATLLVNLTNKTAEYYEVQKPTSAYTEQQLNLKMEESWATLNNSVHKIYL